MPLHDREVPAPWKKHHSRWNIADCESSNTATEKWQTSLKHFTYSLKSDQDSESVYNPWGWRWQGDSTSGFSATFDAIGDYLSEKETHSSPIY